VRNPCLRAILVRNSRLKVKLRAECCQSPQVQSCHLVLLKVDKWADTPIEAWGYGGFDPPNKYHITRAIMPSCDEKGDLNRVNS
jgi:hypothetical protein